MVICLTSSRLNMTADILRQGDYVDEDPTDDIAGEWIVRQDPDSGELIREWKPGGGSTGGGTDPSDDLETFKCMARGVLNASSSVEKFGAMYGSTEFVKVTFPKHVKISKRDRITNIRDSRGNIAFTEEESGGVPTVFNVNSVTPMFDPFGRHIESFAVCERASRQ